MRKISEHGKGIFNNSIRKKIVFNIATLVVISVFLVGYGSFSIAKSIIESNTRHYIEDILLQTVKNIEMRLGNIYDRIFYLQIDSVIQSCLKKANGNEDYLQELSTRGDIQNALFRSVVYNNEIEAVTVVSDSGKVFEINKTLQKHPLDSISKEDIYNGKGSSMWLGTDEKTKTFIVAATINSLSTQKPLGYIVLNIRESYINNIFSQLEFLNSGNVFIMDKSGIIISHNEKSLLNTSINEDYIKRIFEGNANGFFPHVINSADTYIAYRFLEEQGWYIVSLIPVITYSQTLLMLRTTIIVIGLLVILVGILAAVLITNRISRPITRLTLAMKQFGEGELSAYCAVESSDEIGQLSGNFNNMVQNINELIQKVYEETLLKQQAELKSLRMQINPHFFYNTLETINWMARIKGVAEIGIVAKALSELMRLTIGGSDFITIADELKSVNSYISIQTYRFGDKLSVSTDVDHELYEMYIPKLIIQPILENAIVHGIEKKAGNGHVKITGRSENGIIIFDISDDGVGIHPELIKGIFEDRSNILEDDHMHIGINNVDRRIKIYYGEQYGVRITSEEGIGTHVSIIFPGLKFTTDDNPNRIV